jgi:hypothetical protein
MDTKKEQSSNTHYLLPKPTTLPKLDFEKTQPPSHKYFERDILHLFAGSKVTCSSNNNTGFARFEIAPLNRKNRNHTKSINIKVKAHTVTSCTIIKRALLKRHTCPRLDSKATHQIIPMNQSENEKEREEKNTAGQCHAHKQT